VVKSYNFGQNFHISVSSFCCFDKNNSKKLGHELKNFENAKNNSLMSELTLSYFYERNNSPTLMIDQKF